MQQTNPAIDQLGTYRPRLNADAFAHLPKHRRDWLEVFGNTWGDTNKIMPGTCEKCVFGRGEHSQSCVFTAGDWICAECAAKDERFADSAPVLSCGDCERCDRERIPLFRVRGYFHASNERVPYPMSVFSRKCSTV